MRALVTLLFCGAALAQERAFVEMTAPKDAYYVGERVRLTLRFGYDREFFRTNAVPLFPRPMDVPVHVQARIPGDAVPARGPTFALNDDVAEAAQAPDVQRDGRAFAVLQLEKVYLPSEAGDFPVPAPTLRYAYATRFEEDFVTGRVAKDPKDEIVAGAQLMLRILPLPEEGRPPEFDGAVGRFTVRAEADRAAVDEGEILRLTLAIEGEGNMDTPRLVLPGFHVYGTVDQGGQGGRTVGYDIAPLSAEVKEIPAIPFAFFDPGPPPAYRVVRTQPIPLQVRGQSPPREGSTSQMPDWLAAKLAAAVLLSLVGVALVFRSVRRASRDAPPDPDAVRVREALATLRARAAKPGPELADALAEFLAAYLNCPQAAVIGPDLPSRLVEKGFTPGLASRAAATLERLVAARYGGGHAGGGKDFAGLLSEIEAALAPTARAGSPP